jgi:hypothetical protein
MKLIIFYVVFFCIILSSLSYRIKRRENDDQEKCVESKCHPNINRQYLYSFQPKINKENLQIIHVVFPKILNNEFRIGLEKENSKDKIVY